MFKTLVKEAGLASPFDKGALGNVAEVVLKELDRLKSKMK